MLDNLDRFALAWTVLLAIAAAVRLGPWLIAHLLAWAFRSIARFPD